MSSEEHQPWKGIWTMIRQHWDLRYMIRNIIKYTFRVLQTQ